MIAVHDVHKSFGPHPVLSGVSLEIGAGEAVVIIGRSGGGKSVLLKHLIGLLRPDRGRVEVAGEDLACLDERSLLRIRRRFGMLFQMAALFDSLTVGENVGFVLRRERRHSEAEVRRLVAEALEMVELRGIESKMPAELSGGMRKRVAIARALVMDPQLVLFDEPTSELDPLVALAIGREILALNQRTGATSIVVTHDRDLAFGIADRIAFLVDGRLVVVGTPDEVRHAPDRLLQEFLAADFKSVPEPAVPVSTHPLESSSR